MAAAVVVVIYGMQMMSVLLVPFLVAAFLALITVRPMLWLQAHRVPSVLAALLIVTMLMLILVVVGAILGTSIADFTAALPTYQARLDALNQQAFEFVVKHLKVDESTESMSDMIDPGFAMALVAGILNGLRDVLTNTFLIIFTMIFILLEAGTAKRNSRPRLVEVPIRCRVRATSCRTWVATWVSRHLSAWRPVCVLDC